MVKGLPHQRMSDLMERPIQSFQLVLGPTQIRMGLLSNSTDFKLLIA